MGRVIGGRTAEIKIASGVEDGQVIKIVGMGEAGEQASATGDLYVIVKVKAHPIFERKKNDLYAVKEIKLSEAVLGKAIEFKDLNGEVFTVKIPPDFSLREKLQVAGRGMPRFGTFSSHLGRGDLYVSFNLKTPKHLSVKAKKIIEDLEGEL